MIETQARPFPTRSFPALAAQLLGLAFAAVVVFRGAWKYGFSQDDFWWLAQARGLVPWTAGLWRLVSFHLYFQAMSGAAGLDPLPWRLASLGAHIGCSFLLFALLRRFLSTPAAWLGTVCFAVHPALFTALYWTSAIGDVLACAFAIGTVIAVGARGRSRLLAVPLFSLALLSKESTVLLPFWLVLFGPGPAHGGAGDDGPRTSPGLRSHPADPVLLALCAVAVAYGVLLVRMDVFGVRHAGAQQAYSLRFDSGLATGFLTYLGWTANFFLATVRGFADAMDPAVYPWGVAALAAWLVGLASRELRARGWLAAGAWFFALLIPVLPLGNHIYHYYLCAPLAGAVWCVAAAFDAAASRFGIARRASDGRRKAPARRRELEGSGGTPVAGRWVTAVAVAALLVWNGAALVGKIETHPFADSRLRADPTVDRALIARNALDDLALSPLPQGTRLNFWFPRALAPGGTRGLDPTRETYWERNVRSALSDGIGARVFFPELEDARFVGTIGAARAGDLYAVYRLDGHLKVVTEEQLDSLVRIMPAVR